MSFFRKIKKYAVYIGLSAIVCVAFYQVAAMLHPMKWDIADQFFPCRYLLSESLQHGIVPLWCPYINLGYPFYADPQAGVHYPVSWAIALTFGYSLYTLHLEFILHIVLSAWAVYRLVYLRFAHTHTAFASAVVYALGGIFVSNAQHLTWVISVCWLLWSSYYFYKIFLYQKWTDAAKLSLVLAFSLLGGYPAFGIISSYIFAIAFLFFWLKADTVSRKKLLGLFLFAGLLFLLLIANYLISLAEVMPYMNRGEGLTAEQVNINSFTLPSFISLIAPYATVADTDFFATDLSMRNMYLGVLLLPVLLYELLGGRKNSRWLFLIAIFFLLAAVGDAAPVRKWLYYTLPGMWLFKMAAIFRIFAAFFLLMVFSSGLYRVFSGENLLLFRRIVAAYTVLLFVGLLLVKYTLFFPEQLRYHFASQVYGHLVLLAVVLFVLWFWKSNNDSITKVMLVLMVSDMVTSVWKNQPHTVTDAKVSCVALQQKIKQFPDGFYTLPTRAAATVSSIGNEAISPLWQNTSIFRKEVAFDGFNNFYTKNYKKIDYRQLSRPLLSALDSHTSVQLIHFTPNCTQGTIIAKHKDTVLLTQNQFNGWEVWVDSKQSGLLTFQNMPAVEVEAGEHRILFNYKNDRAYYMLIVSNLLYFLLLLLLFLHGVKNRCFSTFLTKL